MPHNVYGGGSRRYAPPTGHGEIQLVLGPMFSGKTTELIRRLKRWRIANYRCLLVKYANDNRYSCAEAATHDNQTLPAVPAVQLKDIRERYLNEYDVFGIDEGQFFPDLVEFCEAVANRGKVAVVAALDGSYRREGFSTVLNLIPKAEDVLKLRAVCVECFGEASFTKRNVKSDQLELIGGSDAYSAVCRQCYLRSTPALSPCNSNKHRQSIQGRIPSPLKRTLESLDFSNLSGSGGRTVVRRKSAAAIMVDNVLQTAAIMLANGDHSGTQGSDSGMESVCGISPLPDNV